LEPGDSIALLVPAFTPYIEIPQLERYRFDVLHIPASRMSQDGLHLWQYEKDAIDALRDPKYKALFVINPSNPPSYALAKETVEQLKDIVAKSNPNLMIVTDDVYATYIPNFRSLLADLPRNTIGVYSFSKYFGATGWRAAVISLWEENIFDELIKKLPSKRKASLAHRYGSLTMRPQDLKFIDRMVADSRQVALNHTAGLSLPQQMQMSLFALFSLIDTENKYRERMLSIIEKRLKVLWEEAGFTLLPDPLRAGYYSEIDMLVWAKKFYGQEFVEYLQENYNPLDIVFRLARETSLVVLNGGGFDAPEWSVRVSLANLNEEDYAHIGKSIRQILTEYAEAWKKCAVLH
jgi:aspartate 4-decarboxylase